MDDELQKAHAAVDDVSDVVDGVNAARATADGSQGIVRMKTTFGGDQDSYQYQ